MKFTPTHVAGFPACCYACGHSATGAGIGNGRDPRFLCDECLELAGKIGAANLDAFEIRAVKEAGDTAGRYLDTIGVTDLAKLDVTDWRRFCATMVEAFGASIRTQAQEGFK